MNTGFRKNLPRYCSETVGFALFLAWVFCTLFGCGLATHETWIDGTMTTYNLERIWLVSGLFEAVGGIAGIVAAHFVHVPQSLVRSRAFGIAACTCAVVSNVLIWLAWTDRFGTAWAFHLPGGALAGLAVALFAILWGDRLGSYDEAHIEFAIPLSFTVAFALYCVLLFTKRGSMPFLVILLAIIVASTLFACRKRTCNPADIQPASAPNPVGPLRTLRGLVSFGVLVCASWVQVAFFRVIATPEIMGNRLTHFIIPFSCACVLSLAMLALCLRHSRYLNVSLAYRWSLPLFMLSYVPILIDYSNPTLRLAAYAVNFLGMFGVQFGCWLGACKYLRRRGGNALHVFGTYAIGEGAGIFAGCCIGLHAVTLPEQKLLVLSALILTAVLFTVMVTGFNPNWMFNRMGKPERSEASTKAVDEIDLDAAFEQSARELQHAYDLTNRETDVAALLLAGRSRPFIRDELTVSINTVSSHVRNIFAKCGVHSQQELMDLARGGAMSDH